MLKFFFLKSHLLLVFAFFFNVFEPYLAETHTHKPKNGTIYLIKVLDTSGDIVLGVRKDAIQVDNFMRKVAKFCDMELVEDTLYNADSAAVEKKINARKPKKKDIIFFYYSGHGTGASKSNRGNIGSPAFNALKVEDLIKKRGARLSFFITDSCEGIFNEPPTPRDGTQNSSPDAANYQRLFLKSKGHLMASACQYGQSAYMNVQTGSYFTTAFIEVVSKECSKIDNTALNWTNLSNDITERTEDLVIDAKKEPQTPYFDYSEVH